MTTRTNWANTYPLMHDITELPHGTVIRDEAGFIYERDDAPESSERPWFLPGIEDGVTHDDVDTPAQVLYAPDEHR